MTKRGQRGFTIVELLIVIVIIGILAAVTIVAYNGIQQRAGVAILESDLKNSKTQLEVAKVDSGTDSYPADTSGLRFSNNTNAEYTTDNSSYCMTVSSEQARTSYYLDSTTGIIAEGTCPGHDGYTGGEVANQPDDCPTGFIPVPGSATYSTQGGFCVMQYEAKNSGGTAVSTASGAPWRNISQTTAITTANAACAGCHLISEAEWLTIAQNVLSVSSNWSGGSVGSGCIFQGNNSSPDACGYDGANPESGTGRDTKASLTLTNGEVIWDLSGNVAEWTSGTASGGQPGASGYSWRQWNALSIPGSLSPNPYPSNANALASSWTATQGIGQVYSDSSQSGQRSFLRGDFWGGGDTVGIFALNLYNSSSYSDSLSGFRVAQ